MSHIESQEVAEAGRKDEYERAYRREPGDSRGWKKE
jgi:hypothetical protein